VFTYDLEKEMELQTDHDELWFKEYKKKKCAHIQEIVTVSMLTEQQKEWMGEYELEPLTNPTCDDANKCVERMVMPNLFDTRRNCHN
jgi:hypothetical protein